MHSFKDLYRLARRLETAWEKCPDTTETVLNRIIERIGWLSHDRARLAKAQNAGLKLVLPQLREDVQASLRAIYEAALEAYTRLDTPIEPIVTAAMLVAELQQLEIEFGDLEFDCQGETIAVSTEPIILEDVYLGPFRICLCWDRLTHCTGSGCFDIVALDPHPSGPNEAVTHLHVKEEELCAGDAAVPLQKALAQGRLADGFCLIRSVLQQYNPRSPHVALDGWDGSSCDDCGRSVSGDDQHYCAGCDQEYCDDCIGCCTACGDSRCSECLSPCAACDDSSCSHCLRPSAHSGEDCCSGCLRPCAGCEAEVGQHELEPETDLCPACQSLREESADAELAATVTDADSSVPSYPGTHHAETVDPVCPAAS